MPTILQRVSQAVADYYDSEETMSDKQFDDLIRKLEKKGIKIDDILGVGYAPNDAFQKIEHEIPSLSLDKTKDRKEIERWLGVQNGVIARRICTLALCLAVSYISYHIGKFMMKKRDKAK